MSMEGKNNWNEISGDPNIPINNASEIQCANFTSTVRKIANVARPTIAGLGALASIIGIIVIIGIMIKFKKYRTFYYRLIMYLMISTLCVGIMQALSVIPLSEYNEDVHVKEGGWKGACVAIGYFSEMSAWLEHVAIAWITVFIILTVRPPTQKKAENLGVTTKTMKICEAVGFSIWVATPILLCWIPFPTHSYGLSGLWCWIKTTNEDCSEKYISGLIYQFLLYYVPFFVLVLFNITTLFIVFFHYCKIYYKYRHMEENKKALKLVIPFCLYPIVYDILFIIAFANRISYAVAVSNRGEPDYDLWIVHSFAESGRSFYPPFIFLVVSTISFLYGKCMNERATKHVRFVTEDQHPSHERSSRNVPVYSTNSRSDTFVHVSQEFASSGERNIRSHTEETEISDLPIPHYGSVADCDT